jgi:hypothetical protein
VSSESGSNFTTRVDDERWSIHYTVPSVILSIMSRSPSRGDDVQMDRSTSEDRVRERPDQEEAPVK